MVRAPGEFSCRTGETSSLYNEAKKGKLRHFCEMFSVPSRILAMSPASFKAIISKSTRNILLVEDFDSLERQSVVSSSNATL